MPGLRIAHVLDVLLGSNLSLADDINATSTSTPSHFHAETATTAGETHTIKTILIPTAMSSGTSARTNAMSSARRAPASRLGFPIPRDEGSFECEEAATCHITHPCTKQSNADEPVLYASTDNWGPQAQTCLTLRSRAMPARKQSALTYIIPGARLWRCSEANASPQQHCYGHVLRWHLANTDVLIRKIRAVSVSARVHLRSAQIIDGQIVALCFRPALRGVRANVTAAWHAILPLCATRSNKTAPPRNRFGVSLVI